MIILRRLSGPQFALNPDLIEHAEATPDTVVTMVNGNKYLIGESLIELTESVRAHRAMIIALAEDMVVEPSFDSTDRVTSRGSKGSSPRLRDASDPAAAVVPIRTREA